MDHFKVFIKFATILLLFYVLVFWPQGMWDISSLARDRAHTPCFGRWSLTHYTAREVSVLPSLVKCPSSLLVTFSLLRLSCKSCFYILDASSLSYMWLANIFSQMVHCLFIFLMVSFWSAKNVNFNDSKINNWLVVLVSCLRNIFPNSNWKIFSCGFSWEFYDCRSHG